MRLNLQGKTWSIVPVARNGLCIPAGTETMVGEAVQKVVRKIIEFGKSERFVQPNNDTQYTFNTLVNKETPHGRAAIEELAKILMECCVPDGLRYMMTKKGIKKYIYSKKVVSGINGKLWNDQEKNENKNNHRWQEREINYIFPFVNVASGRRCEDEFSMFPYSVHEADVRREVRRGWPRVRGENEGKDDTAHSEQHPVDILQGRKG